MSWLFAGPRCGLIGEGELVGRSGGVQAEHLGEGLENVWGRVAIPALFEAEVVVGNESGQQSHSGAGQSGHLPVTPRRKADLEEPTWTERTRPRWAHR